jgi:hypothetical protein
MTIFLPKMGSKVLKWTIKQINRKIPTSDAIIQVFFRPNSYCVCCLPLLWIG